MRLSIYSVKFERPDYVRCELESILSQGWAKHEYELLIIDESKTNRIQDIYREYSDRVNIRYSKSITWTEKDNVCIFSGGRVNQSLNLNYLLSIAIGEFCIYLPGEFVFLDNSFDLLCSHSKCNEWLFFNIPNIDRSYIQTNHIDQIGWFFHRDKMPDFKEMIGSSIRTKYLKAMNGYNHKFMIGWQCEGNEIYDRLLRSDVELIHRDELAIAHIDHDRNDSDWKTVDSHTYRAARRTRLLMDSGYYDDLKRSLRYYRPGTEKFPVVNTEMRIH